MRFIHYIHCLFTTVLLFLATTATAQIALIPQPLSLKVHESVAPFTLSASTKITYSDTSLMREAMMLAEALQPATGFSLAVEPANAASQNCIFLKLDKGVASGKEAYSLKSDQHKVVISGAADAGVFYGTQTLRQLLPAEIFKDSTQVNIQWEIPSVTITDAPRFPWRSYMLDVARNFKSKEIVMGQIEQMAQHKMNRFHWHLTDDQGWRIEIKKYPKLTEIGSKRKDTQIGGWKSPKYTGEPQEGYYTQDDIKEVVQFAADRHIMIIPEIGMPGHATAALASYPEYACKEQRPAVVQSSFGKKTLRL